MRMRADEALSQGAFVCRYVGIAAWRQVHRSRSLNQRQRSTMDRKAAVFSETPRFDGTRHLYLRDLPAALAVTPIRQAAAALQKSRSQAYGGCAQRRLDRTEVGAASSACIPRQPARTGTATPAAEAALGAFRTSGREQAFDRRVQR